MCDNGAHETFRNNTTIGTPPTARHRFVATGSESPPSRQATWRHRTKCAALAATTQTLQRHTADAPTRMPLPLECRPAPTLDPCAQAWGVCLRLRRRLLDVRSRGSFIPFNKNWFTMRVWYGNHLPSLENKWRNGDDRVDSGSNIPLCRKPKSRDGSASVALLLADGLNRCTTAVYVPCVPAVPRGAHAN
jgi:hypothetical protein